MQNLIKISQQTFWQIIGKVVTSLSTFIVLGLVTRNYGEAGTGTYTLALTYLAIFFLLSDFGFNAYVLKKFTGYSLQVTGKEFQKLLGTRILWSLLLVVLAITTLLIWPFADELFSRAVLFGCLAIIFSAVYTTCNLIFQGKLRYDFSVLASSFGTLAGLAVFVYFILNKFPIPFLLFGHFLGWLIIAIAALVLVKIATSSPSARPRNDDGKIFPIFDKPYTINLFKSSWPIAATLAVNVVYFRADAFLLAYFKGASDVGIYNVAFQVFQTILVLPTFMMNVFYPMMLDTLKIQAKRFLRQIKLAFTGLLVLSLLIFAAIFLLAPLIIQIITGPGFIGSTESLRVLSFGFPAYFLSSLLMWVMAAKGRYKPMLIIYTLGLVFNIILNVIYIPQYSYFAAALITVISEYLILGLQIMVLWLL